MVTKAIQTNNFEERLSAWKSMLPIFFFFDKTHYFRYSTYYVHELENLEMKYPGAKEELAAIGISIRRNDFGIGQAIDLAGEQTFMRSAKTAGGIKGFQTQRSTVLKWVRNRAQQSTHSLRYLCHENIRCDVCNDLCHNLCSALTAWN